MARNRYPFRVVTQCYASDPVVEAFARTRDGAEKTAARVRRQVDANNPGENWIAVRVQFRSGTTWENLEALEEYA